ncbi:MAG TPA: T9SS type A sorting domain-containing protein [Ignavibacteriaceae bacterium]|nr:T9SS type A sorting domain-containing protein [Ignavibacteriaceae bacterium]
MLRISFFLFFFSFALNAQIWVDRFLPDKTNLYDIAFRDSLLGIAVGDSGIILITQDGGASWQLQQGIAFWDESLFKIQYLPGAAYLTGSSSANGGFFVILNPETGDFTRVEFPYKEIYLTDSYFVSSDTVFVCGLQGKFLRSFDGLQSWEEFEDPNNFFANRRILFTDAQNGWLTGGRIDLIGFLKNTTDGGVTWTNKLLTIEPMLDIIYLNEDTLFAAGGDPEYGGWIYISSDRGESWSLQQRPGNVITLGSVNFANRKRGWATGAGSVLSSSDLGNTWELFRETPEFIYKSSMRTERSHWFAGTSGFLSEYIDTSRTDTTTGIRDFYRASDNRRFSVFPNPANSQATLSFYIEKNSFVRIDLYDILGRRIKNIFSGFLQEGSCTQNYSFNDLPSGIYFICLLKDTEISAQKFVLNK